MTRASCTGKVTAAVADVAGVEATDVDLDIGILTVTGDYDSEQVRGAINAAGYQVV
ncbi:heavy metal-associated domain-containing protein [Nocardioides sp. InS609-2]|uniref:heavy-metal-associated domain-containing protein n=1 Tax=Nocardioides sp. InS609-2 TaxID=2760705 RepID=UPI0020C0374F|nr:heavy metal-associated domain-containing protein [Nocardioides sp. InS609-2]